MLRGIICWHVLTIVWEIVDIFGHKMLNKVIVMKKWFNGILLVIIKSLEIQIISFVFMEKVLTSKRFSNALQMYFYFHWIQYSWNYVSIWIHVWVCCLSLCHSLPSLCSRVSSQQSLKYFHKWITDLSIHWVAYRVYDSNHSVFSMSMTLSTW